MKLPLVHRSAVRRLAGCLLVSWFATAVEAAPRIGLLLKGRSAFWAAVERGAQDAANAAGLELIAKAPLTENDIAIQLQLLNALAGQDVQAIVVAPAHPEALNEAIATHEAAGIRVVVIDSPLTAASSSAYVGTDQHAAGVAAGQLLARLIAPSDEVCVFRHNQNGSATAQRESGAIAALRETHPSLTIHSDIYSSSIPGEEPARAAVLLERHPTATAMLASGTPGTMALLAQLRQSGRAGQVRFVGFGFNLNPDVVEALQQGALHGWIAQVPEAVGAGGIRAAAALLAGEAVPATTYIPVRIITRDTLADPEVQRLL